MATLEPIENLTKLHELEVGRDLPRAKNRAKNLRGKCKLYVQRNDQGGVEKVETCDNASKTLFCHDMKGGYLEDKYINGVKDLPKQPYHFTHWSLIDTFVYFSHHFISIPTLGWIEAGHTNGVSVLGTIITEFDQGSEICKELLKSRDQVDAFVDKCCEIAMHVGFDGWLLNIENEIQHEHLEHLLYLVQKLTTTMHEKVQNSQVIWYDSVTKDGQLKWQNELNELNAQYFDACDGIFLNYTWSEETLANSVLFSPERKQDIYVGIDVFGRGCPGGGGFASNVALTMIKYHSLSCAIFAPGWTHECACEEEPFLIREEKFWKLLEPLLTHQGLKSLSEPTLNKGCGFENNCWWLDLGQQSKFPGFQDKHELFCDINLVDKSFKIQIGLLCKIPDNELELKLIFAGQNPMTVKESTRNNDQSIIEFHVSNNEGSCLHYLQVMNLAKCDSIKSLKLE